MKEIWKDVINYEGLYKVSNMGRIKALRRESIQPNGGVRVYPEKIMKSTKDKDGYPRTILSKNGKTKTPPIHRIVAKAFVPNPENKPQVNHIDGVKAHNYPCNLEWCTLKENHIHARNSGLMDLFGEKNGNSKLMRKEVLEIKAHLSEGVLTPKEISDMYPVTRDTIYRIRARKIWTHI